MKTKDATIGMNVKVSSEKGTTIYRIKHIEGFTADLEYEQGGKIYYGGYIDISALIKCNTCETCKNLNDCLQSSCSCDPNNEGVPIA
jgi:hypothetical protein